MQSLKKIPNQFRFFYFFAFLLRMSFSIIYAEEPLLFDDMSFEAIYEACELGCMPQLVASNRGKLSEMIDEEGRSLLIASVERLQVDLTKKLLSYGIGLNTRDNNGNNPLHIAIQNNSIPLIQILWRYFDIEEKNHEGYTCLHTAIKVGNSFLLRTFLENGADPTAKVKFQSFDLDPLELSIALGEKECIDVLIDFVPIASTETKDNILHKAITFGKSEILSYLLDKHFRKVKHLLNSVDSTGRTLLSHAAYLGDIASLTLVHSKGGDILLQDQNGRSPAHWGVLGRNREIIEYLSYLRCDLEVKDKEGLKPIDLITNYTSSEDISFVSFLSNLIRQKQIDHFLRPRDLFPENLVFQGGGLKGIAYVGALEALKSKNAVCSLKRFAGTSAGAIMATLLACDYDIAEIKEILMQIDFTDFFDHPMKLEESEGVFSILKSALELVGSPIKLVSNLLGTGGICEGEVFLEWMEEKIKEKTGIRHCTFGELSDLIEKGMPFKHLHIFGTRIGETPEIVLFGSDNLDSRDYVISDIVRISMSIPGIFKPHEIHMKDRKGIRFARSDLGKFIDGGLLKNFPIDTFDKRGYSHEDVIGKGFDIPHFNFRTWGLSLITTIDQDSLETKIDKESSRGLVLSLFHLYARAEQLLRNELKEEFSRIIEIDNQGITLLDFDLDITKKDRLVQAGNDAALQFMSGWNFSSNGRGGLFLWNAQVEELAHLKINNIPTVGFPSTKERDELTDLEARIFPIREEKLEISKVGVILGPLGNEGNFLAHQFATNHLDDFSITWQIDCQSNETEGLGYLELAKVLRLPLVRDNGQRKDSFEIRKLVHGYLENAELHKPWLLILENISKQPKDLPKKGGSILVTTWNRMGWDKSSILELKEVCSNVTSSEEKIINAKNFFSHIISQAFALCKKSKQVEPVESSQEENTSELHSFIQKQGIAMLASWKNTTNLLKEEFPFSDSWLRLCYCLSGRPIPEKWLDKWLEWCSAKDPRVSDFSKDKMIKNLYDFSLFVYENESLQPIGFLHEFLLIHDKGDYLEELDLALGLILESHPSAHNSVEDLLSHALEISKHAALNHINNKRIALLLAKIGEWQEASGDHKAAIATKEALSQLVKEIPDEMISPNC